MHPKPVRRYIGYITNLFNKFFNTVRSGQTIYPMLSIKSNSKLVSKPKIGTHFKSRATNSAITIFHSLSVASSTVPAELNLKPEIASNLSIKS